MVLFEIQPKRKHCRFGCKLDSQLRSHRFYDMSEIYILWSIVYDLCFFKSGEDIGFGNYKI